MSAERRNERRKAERSLKTNASPTPNRRDKQSDSEQLNQQQSFSIRETWAAPMPRPQDLEHYEQILPGFAAHLLEEQQNERIHRNGLEKAEQKTAARNSLLGMIAGSLALFAYLGIVYFALTNGNAQYIKEIIGYPLVALILGFFGKKVLAGNKDK